jgi:protein-disulfide isomerase
MAVPSKVSTRRERRLAERAARHDARRHPRRTRRIGLGSLTLLGLAGGLVVMVLAIVFGTRPAPAGIEPAVVTVAYSPTGVATQGFALGSPDAPVTIDLYEDFQCPACETWGRTVFPSLAANELKAGTVRIVFHDMAFLGPESVAAGRAAYAAAQQHRFWDMWATLYSNQGRENSGAFSRDRLVAMAGRLGLDVARFETDMDSAASQAAVDASRSDAAQIGVSSTPTLIVGGQAIVGVQAYADLAVVVAAAVGQ